MTEAVKTDAENAKTQTEGQGAQSGEPTLAELLAQGKEGLQAKKEPEPKEAPKESKAVDPQQVAVMVRASIKAENEFDSLAKNLSDTHGISVDRAKSLLTGELSTRPDLREAWFNTRNQNPEQWKKIAGQWLKEVGDDFGKAAAKAKEQTSDRAAIRAGANVSPSADTAPDKKPNYRRDPQALFALRRQFGVN